MKQTATVAEATTPKRKYTFRNRAKVDVIPLTRFEVSVERTIQEVQPFLNRMGNSGLPFLVGTLISRFGLTFSEDGHVRKRLLKSILNHLESLGRIQLSNLDSNFPIGQGQIKLIVN